MFAPVLNITHTPALAAPLPPTRPHTTTVVFEGPLPSAAYGIPQAAKPLSSTSALFAGHRHPDLIRLILGPEVATLRREKTTPVPEGCSTIAAGANAPLIGVPGDFLPGYELGKIAKTLDAKLIPRLPNLTEQERAWESAFVDQLCGDVRGTVAAYRAKLGANHVYSVDAAKRLFAGWGPKKRPTNDAERTIRAAGNAALHAVATTIANLAFMQRLDEMATLPHHDPAKEVVITVGGCAAGKGNGLEIAGGQPGAVYDSAGEGEATDIMAKLKACLSRGIRVRFLTVYAHPQAAAQRLIDRAETSGRIVDLVAFARSHTNGVENFRSVCASSEFQSAKADGLVSVTVLHRNAEGDVVKTDRHDVPAPTVSTQDLLFIALQKLAKADTRARAERVLRGALSGLALRWPEYDTVFAKAS